MSHHGGATAIRFHTRPLAEDEVNRLHDELGSLVPVYEVWIAGGDGRSTCVGALAPVDVSEASLERLMAQLRRDRRIMPLTVAVGRFPNI